MRFASGRASIYGAFPPTAGADSVLRVAPSDQARGAQFTRIEMKLDAALDCNTDHEKRLRVVEHKQWWLSGVAAIVSPLPRISALVSSSKKTDGT